MTKRKRTEPVISATRPTQPRPWLPPCESLFESTLPSETIRSGTNGHQLEVGRLAALSPAMSGELRWSVHLPNDISTVPEWVCGAPVMN